MFLSLACGAPLPSSLPLLLLGFCALPGLSALRFNGSLVLRQVGTVLVLDDNDDRFSIFDDDDGYRKRRPLDLRYFNLVEPPALFIARGQGGRHPWPNMDTYDSWLLSPTARRLRVVDDTSVCQSLWAGKVDGTYYAIGGEAIAWNDEEYRGDKNEGRDGLRVLQASSLEEIRKGAWISPRHDANSLAIRGDHPGCVTARQRTGVCMYDNKVSAVRHLFADGSTRWLLFTRANLKRHGGRFVQVAKSKRDSPHAPYGRLQLIKLEGYDHEGPGNVYFIVVSHNPVDTTTLLGMMPVNEGREGSGNGDGLSYIALSISCDGASWSRLSVLVWSTGKDGRTYDHPVDGLLIEGERVYFMVHENVPHIAPDVLLSRIVKFELNTTALRSLTREAKAHLPGCRATPSPSPPPSPPSSSPSFPPFRPPVTPPSSPQQPVPSPPLRPRNPVPSLPFSGAPLGFMRLSEAVASTLNRTDEQMKRMLSLAAGIALLFGGVLLIVRGLTEIRHTLVGSRESVWRGSEHKQNVAARSGRDATENGHSVKRPWRKCKHKRVPRGPEDESL
ncbi:MAG: hypothetical protein SGPRY_008562 [Prymnesium sp.]